MIDRNLYTPGLQFSFLTFHPNFRSISTTMKHFEIWYQLIQNLFKQLTWHFSQKLFKQLSAVKDFFIKSIRIWLTEFRIQLCLIITNKQERLDDMTRQNFGLPMLSCYNHLNLRNVLQIFTGSNNILHFHNMSSRFILSKPRSSIYDARHFGI